MKKQFLTSALVLATSGFAFAGHEILFHANEVQFDAFGSFATGNVDYHTEQTTFTVRRTDTKFVPQTTTSTTFVTTVYPGEPPVVVSTPVITSITELKRVKKTVIERVTIVTRRYDHNAFGGGAGVNYFVTRNFGLGLEGDWLAGNGVINEVAASFIFRFPIENANHSFGCAPYLFLGGGGQFDGQNAGFGNVGGGVECRFSSRFGIFTDGRYVLHDDNINYGQFRMGVRIVF